MKKMNHHTTDHQNETSFKGFPSYHYPLDTNHHINVSNTMTCTLENHSPNPGLLLNIPSRPSLGKLGRPIELKANFFPIHTLPGQNILHYTIHIVPQVNPTKARKIYQIWEDGLKTMLMETPASNNNADTLVAGNVSASTLTDNPKDHEDQFVLNHHHGKTTRTNKSGQSTKQNKKQSSKDQKENKSQEIYPIYDGRKSLFTVKPLPLQVPSLFQIDFFDEEEYPGREVPQKFKLSIEFAGEINMYKLALYLDGQTKQVPYDALNVLDVLLLRVPSLNYTTIGRSVYTPEASVPIANAAQLWQGFHQSLKASQGQLLINLDVSATTFYQPGPVIDLVTKILGKEHPFELRHVWTEKDRTRVERVLKGLKICVNHRGKIKQKFKISKITSTPANKTYFSPAHNLSTQQPNYHAPDAGNGTTPVPEIDVAYYFLNRYQIRLNYPHLPCIVVGDPSKNIYLPFEVCDILPGQRHLKKLNEKQTAEMIKFTCQPPQVRSSKISSGISMLQQPNDPYLKEFNVEIATDMTTVNARVLPSPTVSYHPASKESTVTPREGTWNLRDKMVAQGTTLRAWTVLVFGNEDDYPLVSIHRFLSSLANTCEECGIYVPNKQPPISYTQPLTVNVEKVLSDVFMLASNAYQERPQLILCILPNTSVSLYAEIKRVSDTVIGIPTQCIQAKHMFAAKRQYCANVCLKVNVKLGGMNSFLSHTQIPFLADQSTMIFGADVTHPTPGSGMNKSIAALVGSMDMHCAKYAASIRFQKSHVDTIQELSAMVKELILNCMQRQNTAIKPEKILFYRDGLPEQFANTSPLRNSTDSPQVSSQESKGFDYQQQQIERIVSYEVEAIKRACREIDSEYNPKVTFISVQKRHHARFFPTRREDMDRSGNILPGTVIETGVTHPSEFDFYLCSHPGLQGTSKPTHYHIYHDDNQLGPDTIQDLTYKLCYLYCRATRSVSVCPPAYYAHLVATRARFHASVLPTSPFSIETMQQAKSSSVSFESMSPSSLDDITGGLAGLQITPCSSSSTLADQGNSLAGSRSGTMNNGNNPHSTQQQLLSFQNNHQGNHVTNSKNILKRQKTESLSVNTDCSKSFQYSQVRPELAQVMYFM